MSSLVKIMIKIIFIKEAFQYENTKGSNKGILKNEKFTNTNNNMESIKSMFVDVLNEVL